MRRSQRNSRGQVVLLVTLSLMMMLGMLGLAVDLGFSFFVKKSAQAAADAAALAAVSEAYARVGEDGPFICGVQLDCSPASCPGVPAGSNFQNGCLYAQRDGFAGGGRQTVRLEGGAWVGGEPVSPPTAPGVHVYYWVTARVSETVPQLFSAIMGNTAATSAARATAAIIDAVIDPSLNLLNRQNDPTGFAQGPPEPGVDLAVAGGVTVIGGKGIVLASTAHGPTEFAGDADTGHSSGSATVIAPFTYIRGAGTVNPEVNWLSTEPGLPGWQNGYRERGYFQDPMRGRGQPPPPSNLKDAKYDCGLTDGSMIEGPVTLGPGNYYTYKIEPGSGERVATGKPIRFRGEVRFASGGACFAGIPNDNGFGEYVFFGGLHFSRTQTTAIFDPGRYVLAGALQSTGPVFSFTNQVVLKDNTTPGGLGLPNKEGNAGEIFILTDATYPGLYVPPAVLSIVPELKFGSADLQTGSDSSTLIDLHGLNNDRNNSGYWNVPAELDLFRPVVIWQDQRNSLVTYTSYGYIDCGQPDKSTQAGCTGYPDASLDNPIYNKTSWTSPAMKLQAGPQTNLYGAIYQPRGAWMDLQGSPGARSPLQLVTGALKVHGGGEVRLEGISNPIKRKVVALVE